ncbi:DUF120 domain-containing protein [Nostoc commune]|uniref:DUF120 domain-containing protein n=1 Tax=Nostoc commune TaxID=1178 RepID=UPI001C632F32
MLLEKNRNEIFPGTLNIQLEQPYHLPKNVIRLEKEEYGGTVSVSIVPCQIFSRDAFILRTDKNNTESGDHPKTIIEIACDVKLRELYNLKDNDLIEVEIHDVRFI